MLSSLSILYWVLGSQEGKVRKVSKVKVSKFMEKVLVICIHKEVAFTTHYNILSKFKLRIQIVG